MFNNLKKSNYNEIHTEVKLTKTFLASIVNLLRSQDISLYNEKLLIDHKFESLKYAGPDFNNLIAVETTGNGNCFYNAVSICLFGHENFNLCLRFVILFIFFENERYFRNLIKFSYGEQRFNKQIMEIATNFSWANEYAIHGMSIALNRALNIFSLNESGKLVSSQQYCANSCQLLKKPISIGHKNNHFVALMPLNINMNLPSPNANQFNKFVKILKIIIEQISNCLNL